MGGRLGPGDLVVTNCSSAWPPFAEHVRVAAAHGFAGLSLWPSVYADALAAGHRPAEMRRMLDDHGLVVNDVDAAILWAGAQERTPATPGGPDAPPYEMLFEAGAELGADYANVAIFADAPFVIDRAVEEFAAAATRCVDVGLRPHLEFLPISPIADAATAWRVVEAAGVDAAGIMVDAWHVQRGPTDHDQLRSLPAGRILGVQLCDAPAEPADDLLWETRHARLLPGEGAGDTVGLVRALDGHGCTAPVTVEVYSDELDRLDPDEATRRVAAATRRVLAAAGHRVDGGAG